MSTITISPWAADARPARVIVRPRRQSPTRVRLTRRGRVLVVVAFLAILGVFMIALGGWATGTFDRGTATPVRVVQVHPGDTLFVIAGRIAAPGHVREMVAQIEQLNSLSSPVLQVGQKIAVPRTATGD